MDVPSVPPSRILVAEDNPLNQTFAKEILEEAGHEVTLAENGREALELMKNAHFDIVFMDVQMPQMDGLEATRRIRAGETGEAGHTIPIIAATAFAVQGDKEKCLEAGMSGYVVKPLTSHDLLMAVARYSGSDSPDNHNDSSTATPEPTGAETIIDVDAALVRLGNKRALFDKLVVIFLEIGRASCRERVCHYV